MRIGAVLAIFVIPAVLRPGSADIDSRHFQNDSRSLRMVLGDSEITRIQYEWRVLPPDDLLLVVTGAFQSKAFVDSSVVRRRGLAPVREVSRFGSTIDEFTYDGPRVTLVHTTPDSGTRRVQHTYDGPVFDFQELDDLLRSLPLREGYERILPLYSEGTDTLEMDTVRVVNRAANGEWTLRFADPAITATYGIDERTRRIVRHEFTLRRNGTTRRYLD
jgi:hypothetical protein